MPRQLWKLMAVAAALACFAASRAAASQWCDHQVPLSADQHSRLLRFSEVIKAELSASGQSVGLLARSGLNLARFGIRYSHAGISLKGSHNSPWSVRQLYFACDEGQPRIFDQGMAGFVLGTDNPAIGYVSAVLLPPEPAKVVEAAALDNRQALALLHPHYSPNAYAYGLRYQNCNQWLAELLATALGSLAPSRELAQEGSGASEPPFARARAQSWLRQQGYLPSIVQVGSRLLMWAAAFIPLIRSDDHPDDDLALMRYQVSMPAAIEAFIQARHPQAVRIEFCQTEQHIVVHRGWTPVADGCVPTAEDRVIPLD